MNGTSICHGEHQSGDRGPDGIAPVGRKTETTQQYKEDGAFVGIAAADRIASFDGFLAGSTPG
jgi:hypothetical protein